MLAFTLHSRRPSPWRSLPSEQNGACQTFSARKVAQQAGIPSSNAMRCGLHENGTPCRHFLDKEVRRPAFQFITRGSSSPWSLWVRPTLYKISFLHWGSGFCQMEVVQALITFPRSIEEDSKRERERKTCECICRCWKQPSRRAASGSHSFCGKRETILSSSSEKDGEPLCRNERWHRGLFQFYKKDRRMRVLAPATRVVRMLVSGV